MKGENLLGLYNEIIASKPYTLREDGVIARISEKDNDFDLYLEKLTYFNEELRRLIGNIMGQLLINETVPAEKGIYKKEYSLSNAAKGIYYVQILQNCIPLRTEKMVVK